MSAQLELHILSPIETSATLRMKLMQPELRGHPIAVQAYRARTHRHSYYVGFGVWDDDGPTSPCSAVIERLGRETRSKRLVIRIISNEEQAWQRSIETLLAFRDDCLLMAYSSVAVSEAAMLAMFDAPEVILCMEMNK